MKGTHVCCIYYAQLSFIVKYPLCSTMRSFHWVVSEDSTQVPSYFIAMQELQNNSVFHSVMQELQYNSFLHFNNARITVQFCLPFQQCKNNRTILCSVPPVQNYSNTQNYNTILSSQSTIYLLNVTIEIIRYIRHRLNSYQTPHYGFHRFGINKRCVTLK